MFVFIAEIRFKFSGDSSARVETELNCIVGRND